MRSSPRSELGFGFVLVTKLVQSVFVFGPELPLQVCERRHRQAKYKPTAATITTIARITIVVVFTLEIPSTEIPPTRTYASEWIAGLEIKWRFRRVEPLNR
jgi:hypothetical protein